MNRSTPALSGAAAPVPDDDQAPVPDDPQQLELRLFERIDAFQGVPPDRALWRELLDLAIGTVKTFRAQGQSLSAAAVHHMGWAVYGRTNRAGIAEVTNNKLAEDTRRKRPVVTALITVLNRLRVIRTTRASRRRPSFHRLNLGGMAWPAIRRRARMMHHEQAKLDLQAEDQLSLPGGFPLPASCQQSGPLSCQQSGPLKGYVQGEISRAKAAAGTSRANSADHRQEQQQPGRKNRIEGLIGAIAARSRALGRPFDEDETRQDIAGGERTVDDLQRQADELDADCLARPFTDPATGRHVKRNPEAIAASVEHQRRLAADEGRPFDEAAARLEAERADDLHLAECLALADRRQERAGEDGD